MALLRERRSMRGWSTSTAGTLMADKTNAGQAGPVIVAAAEGLILVGAGDFVAFPLLSCDSLVDGVTPGLAVCSYSRPLAMVDVAGPTDFRMSLKRFFGAPLLRWPVRESSRTIWGRQWCSILDTCPAQRSCDFNSMASMLEISACSSTSTLAQD